MYSTLTLILNLYKSYLLSIEPKFHSIARGKMNSKYQPLKMSFSTVVVFKTQVNDIINHTIVLFIFQLDMSMSFSLWLLLRMVVSYPSFLSAFYVIIFLPLSSCFAYHADANPNAWFQIFERVKQHPFIL